MARAEEVIEELKVETWITAPASLSVPSPALDTVGVKERLVCAYFPPHVAFSEELLKSADKKVLKVTERKDQTELTTSEGNFSVRAECQITCSNGGALYLLGEAKDGVREAWLWRLTEGSEHG